MTKASLALPNGTTVTIEGTSEEVDRLLKLYAGQGPKTEGARKTTQGKQKLKPGKAKAQGEELDLAEIVNLIKNCDEAESVEERILDRTSLVNRVLLSLYVVHEYMANKYALTTGDINKITTDLGVPVSTANVSHAF